MTTEIITVQFEKHGKKEIIEEGWEYVLHDPKFQDIYSLSSVDLSDAKYLRQLPISLVKLSMMYSSIPELSGISHLVNLEELSFAIGNIKKIAELLPPNLKKLYLCGNPLEIVENLNEGLEIADFGECGNTAKQLVISQVPASLISINLEDTVVEWQCGKPKKLAIYPK